VGIATEAERLMGDACGEVSLYLAAEVSIYVTVLNQLSRANRRF
jgi:hypothetical protein